MDPVTLFMTLSSLSLAMKDFVGEKANQQGELETDCFRKRLNKTINEIHESTGVSEIILNEVTEKLDTVHSRLDQKQVNEDMMLSVLKSYIDNDVKQMISSDLCDQQKWILKLVKERTLRIGSAQSWMPEPKFMLEDLDSLESEGYIRKHADYVITRKGNDYVNRGIIFSSHWNYDEAATGMRHELRLVSSNLRMIKIFQDKLSKGYNLNQHKSEFEISEHLVSNGDYIEYNYLAGNSSVLEWVDGVYKYR